MNKPNALNFVDVFAGCGGLSLGLFQAGLKGLFAIEADRFAFETLQHNLLGDGPFAYDWPGWLPREPRNISGFIGTYREHLEALEGKVDLVVGGPPCQGFSLAGRRKKDDPRNRLFKHYVDLVEVLRPPLMFFENVRGVAIVHGKKHQPHGRGPGRPATPFSVKIQKSLDAIGYKVYPKLVRAMDFGVPQLRPRYIMIAVDKKLLADPESFDPFAGLETARISFLAERGLPTDRPVGTRDALSDLEIQGRRLVPCDDVKGYEQISYREPSTTYQKLLHGDMNGMAPNSLRLAKHRDEIRERFDRILRTCRRGVQLNPSEREMMGIKKKCVVAMDPDAPSHTLTSLPDDLIHYAEPRILSVREYARLQSFPDSYAFKGKYTTGGSKRVKECPRYTQVANAVPPFLAEVLGGLLARLASALIPTRAIATGNGGGALPDEHLRP